MSRWISFRSTASLVALVVLALALSGCSKVTKDNYDKINASAMGGTPQKDVENMMGGPGKPATGQDFNAQTGLPVSFPGITAEKWEDGNKKIVCAFADGKCVDKTSSGL